MPVVERPKVIASRAAPTSICLANQAILCVRSMPAAQPWSLRRRSDGQTAYSSAASGVMHPGLHRRDTEQGDVVDLHDVGGEAALGAREARTHHPLSQHRDG